MKKIALIFFTLYFFALAGSAYAQSADYDAEREAGFEQDAFLFSAKNLKARFFGEIARSCVDTECNRYEDACVTWNKFKDECYEHGKSCSLPSCKRYKVYCELVIVNQDEEPLDAAFDAYYVTADGVKSLVKKMSHNIEQGHGWPSVWTYEVDADDIGRCEHSLAPIKESDSPVGPCQSGGLTTSVYNDYQMIYQDEDFIRINDIDLLKDVSQLKDLTCLQYLDATDRTIKGDIANLNNLKNLEVFSLYSNPEVYGDICSLAGAVNLRSLKFAFDPKITGDISCLKDLTKLETFAMTHTQIYGDLSVFANMPNLKAIYVSGTNVTGDICAFSKLTNLEELGIADEYPGNPEITGDLSCLDNLQKLKRVSIYNTGTTNCEQFTKSHPNIAQMGPTESGRPAGGGCSKESLKTLVDVAQKYERKIGKEVQTEVRGKPDYNKPDKTSKGTVASGDENQLKEPDQRNFITKFIDWIKSLFGWTPKRSIEAAAGQSRQSEDRNQIRSQAGPGGCSSQAECDVFCSRPENQEECSNFTPPDEGPPKECTVDGKFIGEEKCKAMMEKGFSGDRASGNSPPEGSDRGPPEECTIDGKFIGEEKCKTMMEKPQGNAQDSSAQDSGPPKECTIDGKFIGEEKCTAMMEIASEGEKGNGQVNI